MKNIKYIIFTILFLFINVFCVNASCTDEEISTLKEKADEIKITYKHLGKSVGDDDRVSYNIFEVKVKNVPNDFYLMIDYDKYIPNEGQITDKLRNGTWYFDFYSNQCGEMISQIKVYIPTFNIYSLEPLCEGIDGEDFLLCAKYYDYGNITYDEFEKRVTSYRVTHNITNVDYKDKQNISFSEVVNIIVNFVIKYKFYFLGAFAILLLVIIIIVIARKKKKRGILE